MRDSAIKPDTGMLKADTRSVNNYLKSLAGRKILSLKQTSAAQWFCAELCEYADKNTPEGGSTRCRLNKNTLCRRHTSSDSFFHQTYDLGIRSVFFRRKINKVL